MLGSRNSIKEDPSPAHRSNRNSMLSDDDDNRSRSGSILSNSSFLSSSSSFSEGGSTGGKKNRKITSTTVKFVTEAQWFKNKNCIVCERKIEKLKGVSSHHCRICGYGVCGDCSKGRVNGNRTCDVCFRKVEIEPHEKRREDIVTSKTERVTKANDILKKRATDADTCQKKISVIRDEINAGQEKYTKGIEKAKEEKEQMENDLKKTKENIDTLKKNVETNRDMISEREEKLREVLDKLKEMKRELEKNKRELTESQMTYEDKKSQLNVLQETKLAIETTKKNQLLTVTESIAESDKVSFISDAESRDFTSEKQDGQYNISLQPVNI